MPDLFFSMNSEGYYSRRFLEIYNPTYEIKNLDDYALGTVSNGGTGDIPEYWVLFTEGATIAPRGHYVVAHPNSDANASDRPEVWILPPAVQGLVDQTYAYMSNGDDGFKLVKKSKIDGTVWGNDVANDQFEVLDCIGHWGQDPGSAWDVAGVDNATRNTTIIRKTSVQAGNSDWATAAGTNADDSEWIVYPGADQMGNEQWIRDQIKTFQSSDYNLLQNALINSEGKNYDIIHLTNKNKTLQQIVAEYYLSSRLLEYNQDIFNNGSGSTSVLDISTNIIKDAITDNYHNHNKLYDGNFPESWEARVIGIMKKNDPSSKYPGFKVDGIMDDMMMTKDNENWVVSDTYDGSGLGEYSDYVSTPSAYQDDFYLIIQSLPSLNTLDTILANMELQDGENVIPNDFIIIFDMTHVYSAQLPQFGYGGTYVANGTPNFNASYILPTDTQVLTAINQGYNTAEYQERLSNSDFLNQLYPAELNKWRAVYFAENYKLNLDLTAKTWEIKRDQHTTLSGTINADYTRLEGSINVGSGDARGMIEFPPGSPLPGITVGYKVVNENGNGITGFDVTNIQLPEYPYNRYPPTSVTGVTAGNNFSGRVAGQPYGNGDYAISVTPNDNNNTSARPLGGFFDGDETGGTANYLLQSKNASFTFTFPHFLTIKEMHTHNNNSCGTCEITINDNVVYDDIINITPGEYTSINLHDNTEISNSVTVRLYNGSKTYMQNSEFYFMVEKYDKYPISSVTGTTDGNTFSGTISGQPYGNGMYAISVLAKNQNEIDDPNIISSKPLGGFFDGEIGSGANYLLQSKDVTINFMFPESLIVKEMYTHNNHSCGKCHIIINGKDVYGSDDLTSTDPDNIGKAAGEYVSIDLHDNTEISNSVTVRLYDGDKTFMQNTEFYFRVERYVRYPPSIVPGVTDGNDFEGTISGQPYGNGVYTISVKPKDANGNDNENIISSKPLGGFFDGETGSDANYLLQSKDVTINFMFPESLIVKEMHTHNNHSCGKCHIIINGKDVYGSDDLTSTDPDNIGKAAGEYVSIDLHDNTEISNSVTVRLYDGDKTFMQNTEFYFMVEMPVPTLNTLNDIISGMELQEGDNIIPNDFILVLDMTKTYISGIGLINNGDSGMPDNAAALQILKQKYNTDVYRDRLNIIDFVNQYSPGEDNLNKWRAVFFAENFKLNLNYDTVEWKLTTEVDGTEYTTITGPIDLTNNRLSASIYASNAMIYFPGPSPVSNATAGFRIVNEQGLGTIYNFTSQSIQIANMSITLTISGGVATLGNVFVVIVTATQTESFPLTDENGNGEWTVETPDVGFTYRFQVNGTDITQSVQRNRGDGNVSYEYKLPLKTLDIILGDQMNMMGMPVPGFLLQDGENVIPNDFIIIFDMTHIYVKEFPSFGFPQYVQSGQYNTPNSATIYNILANYNNTEYQDRLNSSDFENLHNPASLDKWRAVYFPENYKLNLDLSAKTWEIKRDQHTTLSGTINADYTRLEGSITVGTDDTKGMIEFPYVQFVQGVTVGFKIVGEYADGISGFDVTIADITYTLMNDDNQKAGHTRILESMLHDIAIAQAMGLDISIDPIMENMKTMTLTERTTANNILWFHHTIYGLMNPDGSQDPLYHNVETIYVHRNNQLGFTEGNGQTGVFGTSPVNIVFYSTFIPTTKAELQTALSELITNTSPNSYNSTPIEEWDVTAITDMSELFSGVTNKHLFNEDISDWDMSNVTDMSQMFRLCTTFNNGGQPLIWNTSSVTNMSQMFIGCHNFNQPLEFDTSSVINMEKMFYEAWNFNSELIDWNVSSVTNMDQMFRRTKYNNGRPHDESGDGGVSGDKIGIKDWNVSNVINMSGMFKDSKFNQNIKNWNVSNVTKMIGMFQDIKFNQDISSWNTSRVIEMHFMFSGNQEFDQDIRGWKVWSVNSGKFQNMFASATAMNTNYSAPTTPDADSGWFNSYVVFFTKKADLQTALSELIANTSPNSYNSSPIEDWDVTAITDMSELFSVVTDKNLFNEDISAWDMSNVTNMNSMFKNCSAFNNGGQALTWDTSSVTDMSSMFDSCGAFNQAITLNTSSVTTMTEMFRLCTAFNNGGQPLAFSDTSSVTNMSSMFNGCGAFNQPITFDTSSVTDMNQMFIYCTTFNQELTFSDTSSVTNMERMFRGCESFNNGGQPLDFNTSSVTTMIRMFYDCKVFDQEIRDWDASAVIYNDTDNNFSEMFYLAALFNSKYSPPDPMTPGFFAPPQTDDNIQTAVNLWFSDQTSCEEQYGHMSNWDVSNITNMRELFRDKGLGTTIPDLSGWNTSKVTSMEAMFRNANTTGINIGNWDVSSVTHSHGMVDMFKDADLTGIEELNWDVSNVKNMQSMFNLGNLGWPGDDPSSSQIEKWGGNVDLSNWKGDKRPELVTDMTSMFFKAYYFNSEVPFGDMPNLSKSRMMFLQCINFNNGDTGNNKAKPFNWTRLGDGDQTDNIFNECRVFNQDLSSIDVSNITNFSNMFLNCRLLDFDFHDTWMPPEQGSSFANMFKDCTALIAKYGTDGQPLYDNDFGETPHPDFFQGPPFVPTTKAELQTAINEWCDSPRVTPGSYYGKDINVWDISAITDMSNLFNGQTTFNDDISGWNTSDVTSMEGMFKNCSAFNNGGQALTWDTSSVTNMSNMFKSCSNFNQPITFDTSSVEDMNNMFKSCSNFNQPITFDTSSVEDMNNMFAMCQVFNEPLTFSDTSSVTDMSFMFYGCSAFNQPLTWNTSSVTNMTSMFRDCTVFNYDLRGDDGVTFGWDVSSVADGNFVNMFFSASAMNTNYSAPTTPTIDYFYAGFRPKTKTELQAALNEWFTSPRPTNNTYDDYDISVWNTSLITDMEMLFVNRVSFNDDISGWDVSNVENMRGMFYRCRAFNINISGWDVSSVTNMELMFYQCESFNNGGQPLTWNTSSVTNMSKMFNECIIFNQPLDFNTSSVENMSSMFKMSPAFNKPLTFSDTSSVTDMSNMFEECWVFNNGGQALTWDTSSVINMSNMFKSCSDFNQPITFSDTSSVTNMSSMFRGCTVFKKEIRHWDVSSVLNGNFVNMFNTADAFKARYLIGNTPTVDFFNIPETPIITINGYDTYYIEKSTVENPTTFTDDGATATANGETVAVTVTSITGPNGATSVDTSIEGLYYITYSATNLTETATSIRVVQVYVGQLPICFPKDTPVLTNLGPVAIEKLNPDEHTICGKEIVAITQTKPFQKHIVCFDKNSLGTNIPSQKTLCSKEHKISYQGEMTKARDLVDLCENVTFVPYNGETLYNVLLKQHDTMMINNMICETLHPDNIMAKISQIKDGQKKGKIICELSKIIKENNISEYQKLYASL